MRRRTVAAISAAAIVAIALVGVGVALSTGAPNADSQAFPSDTGTANAPQASTDPVPTPSASLPTTDPPAVTAPDPTAPPATQPAPLSEAPPSASATPGLPPTTPLPRILPDAPPPPGSATGQLAADFPAEIPAAPQSTIEHSAVVSEGTRVQATLTASSTLSVAEVLDYYRGEFAKYGMFDSPSPVAGDGTALTFSRDDDAVTITATPSGGGADYVLFGTLTARG